MRRVIRPPATLSPARGSSRRPGLLLLAGLPALLLLVLVATQALAAILSFQATPLSDRIVIRWQTSDELDTDFYYLYRSTSPGGPWGTPTEEPRKELYECDNGCTHVITDTAVTPGVLYYYRLQEYVQNQIQPNTVDDVSAIIVVSPSPTGPTATPTRTRTPTPSASRTPTRTPSTAVASRPSPGISSTPSFTATATPTGPAAIATARLTPTAAPAATWTPQPTPTRTTTATPAPPTATARTPRAGTPGITPGPDILAPGSVMTPVMTATSAAAPEPADRRLVVWLGGGAAAIGAAVSVISLLAWSAHHRPRG